MSLPQEILLEILGHFVQPDDVSLTAINHDLASPYTLASSCRVSKHFNAAATPLLYRHVRMFDGDTPLFARTILGDLTTRRMVKSLSLEFELQDASGDGKGDDERRRIVPRIGEGRWDYDRCLSEAMSLVEADATSPGIGGADILVSGTAGEPNFDGMLEEDLAAVLLFVLPELRCLRLKFDPMTGRDDPTWAGYWTCRLLLHILELPSFVRGQQRNRTIDGIQNAIPASLFHLEEMIMCNPFEPPGTIKECYPPIVFCHLDHMQPFWGLPNIKSLTLERVEWDGSELTPQRFTSSVEHLELSDTAIKPSQLPQLLQHFPSLRSITYGPADLFSLTDYNYNRLTPDMADADGIEAIIRSCNSKLERITIMALTKDDEFESEIAQLTDYAST